MNKLLKLLKLLAFYVLIAMAALAAIWYGTGEGCWSAGEVTAQQAEGYFQDLDESY